MSKPDVKSTFATPNGLTFWMDYRGPGEMPTIRTKDTAIWIRFLPEQFRSKQAFLMACDGGTWLFTCPAASSMLDTSEYEDLRARNPDLDMAIAGIARSYAWIERLRGNSGVKEHEVNANAGFNDRAQQSRITDLFCDLMAWSALNGPAALARGGYIHSDLTLQPGLVGFDKPLQARLDAGEFIGV
ncbi:hypothetical protein ANTHELSMS3_02169 [Antarctobacter heliothermus]|uniref:Uncharacterized protein n=1 Tax=Antarctobacter heliothermus TaxID=74033 RepID=A0A222E3R8_9RHOB|nr:hypothetical protein [Antarctobacter heliothermus]ASP20847.1 hypothetical protein ANTHELSMS3_02169 [Antarctobacter heliothermus]